MGNSVHTRSPVRRAPRVLPSLLATPMAVLLSASLVFGPTTVTDDLPVDPITGGVLMLLVVAVPALAVLASVGAWRNNRRLQWGATGGLLVFGAVPFGLVLEVLLVGILALLGLFNTVPDRRWYDVWLAIALLVPLWGVGSLVVVYVPGHAGVMVAVGGALIFGATISVVAASTGAGGPAPDTVLPGEAQPGSSLLAVILSGVAHGPEWRPTWAVIALLSITVTVFHFLGLVWGIYRRYWFWDVMTHTLSGFGVAGIIYLLRPAAFGNARRLFVLLPAVVLTIGAAFEVYEYLFREFYYRWSFDRYLRDTVEDLAYDTLGALLFALFPYSRLVGRRERNSGGG